MIVPKRAPVRPRVFCPQSGEVLPLDDELLELVKAGAPGAIALVGPPGSGKTTALLHLVSAMPSGVLFLDDPSFHDVLHAAEDRLVVFTAETAIGLAAATAYRLASWGDDEFIEYLLAVHKPRCASVMSRLPSQDRLLFDGLPEVWRIVLDLLAQDETLIGARSALHRYLESLLPDTDLVERSRSACLNHLATAEGDGVAPLEKLGKPGFTEDLRRVLRHRAVQVVLAAERIALDLHGESACDYLALRLPRDLVQVAAAAVFHDGQALEHLRQLLAGPPWSHAMAASMLHAAKIGWVPDAGTIALAGAYLERACWPEVRLPKANLDRADLSGSDLRRACLDGASATEANLSCLNLQGASLDGFRAEQADLSHADLSNAVLEVASLAGACLKNANLDEVRLEKARLVGANLTGASFRGADLRRAVLTEAILKDADFSGASLREAILSGLRLREACFAGACFVQAELMDCDLEGMELPAADFSGANLKGALLTASQMAGASFHRADLREAKLGEVDWENADLRGADLRGATFHMGSSRSGLVGSVIPCEGSKTGFYTDDFDEQHFKAPEEIRKANLRGADLRGARIDDVDFYLVDLRGAQFDCGQAKHLQRCGAILHDKRIGD